MIRNIWAVGRNYADHAKEMGAIPPKEPLIFLKAGSCQTSGRQIAWPAWASDVHHELELALEFGPTLEFTRFALALDLTERRLQKGLKERGEPWTLAKSFRGSCPLSPALPWPAAAARLRLHVNGDLRQDGLIADMIFSPETLKTYLLRHFPVVPGDWLLTGTPAGVGPLKEGDMLHGEILDPAGGLLLRADWACSPPFAEG